MKLHFVCIGAQKAGTTKLHEIFKNHDSVFLPEEKESHFFEIEELYERGINYFFNTYYSNYKEKEPIIGLFDPNLQLDKLYVKRVLDQFSDIKILFVLRNPVTRAYSHYKMSKLRGFETNDFLTSLELEQNRLKNPKEYHKGYKTKNKGHFEKNHFGYISRGLYYELLQFLEENIDQSNYKIILFEELIDNIDEISNGICDFINVPKFEQKIEKNKSNQARELRFSWVNRLLKDSQFINLSKMFASKKLKAKLKKLIIRMNSKNSSALNDLNSDEKKMIYNKYFKEEVLKIESDFNLNLSHWKY
jgi:hypothetical protein